MARIRSVHPGLFTDEAFMSLSTHARILMIGLWCEADDQGVFEWKPLTLKARLLPVDMVEITDLLDELQQANVATRFEADGRQYGAVRNFRKFQRPKKPTSMHPLPAEFVTYVGLDDDSGEPRGKRFPQGGENPPQMEDGGCRMEKKASEAKASSAARDDNEFDLIEGKLRRAAGVENDPSPGLLDLSPVMPFLDAGYSLDRDILPVIKRVAAKQGQKPRSWRYYQPALEEAFARRPEVPDKPKVAEKVFVEKGSDAWRAWCTHAGKTYPETEDRSQGIVRMGWHFPTEYPQAQETAA